MGEQTKADHPLTVAVVTLTAIVFTLDVLTPLRIATWTLYVLPLGLTCCSTLLPLTFMVAGACTVFTLLRACRRISLSRIVYWLSPASPIKCSNQSAAEAYCSDFGSTHCDRLQRPNIVKLSRSALYCLTPALIAPKLRLSGVKLR